MPTVGQVATCRRKVAYRQEMAADDAAARHPLSCGLCRGNATFASYRCPVCPWWHVGHRDWRDTRREGRDDY